MNKILIALAVGAIAIAISLQLENRWKNIPERKTVTWQNAPSTTLEVHADQYYTDSGVDVSPGEKYSITAEGVWIDWFINSTSDGFVIHFKPFDLFTERVSRVKDERLFTLIGCLNKTDASSFRVGSGTNYTATQPGRLYLYANDLNGFYWNNYGSVNVTIVKAT